MKWRSARSPNGTSAICTPGGYQRDTIGKLGRSKCGAAPMAVKMLVASARCSISCLITLISAFSPGLHPGELGLGQALIQPALERELRVQVLTHQAVLELAGLTQQIHQLLPGIHPQRRLSQRIARDVARHGHRLTYEPSRMRSAASQATAIVGA